MDNLRQLREWGEGGILESDVNLCESVLVRSMPSLYSPFSFPRFHSPAIFDLCSFQRGCSLTTSSCGRSALRQRAGSTSKETLTPLLSVRQIDNDNFLLFNARTQHRRYGRRVKPSLEWEKGGECVYYNRHHHMETCSTDSFPSKGK